MNSQAKASIEDLPKDIEWDVRGYEVRGSTALTGSSVFPSLPPSQINRRNSPFSGLLGRARV
jgi:hypothetical protein